MPTSTQWQNATDFFITTFAELAVLFVVISFVVSLVNYYLPPTKVRQLLSGHRGYGVAIALGAVTPFCSCSTLPMLLGLLKARAAFGPLMAFLITSPLLNPFVVALFWLTFGAKVTLLYCICVVAIAACAGVSLQYWRFDRYIRQDILQPERTMPLPTSHVNAMTQSSCCLPSTSVPKPLNIGGSASTIQSGCYTIETSACCPPAKSEPGAIAPVFAILPTLFRDAVKQLNSMLPYIIIGVAVGAALHGFVPVQLFSQLAQVNTVVLIPLAAFISIFLYVRASTMIPIATSLLAKGLSMGTVMSLTIAGAGASLPEMIMLKKIFHWPLLLVFVLLVILTACITGFSIELFA